MLKRFISYYKPHRLVFTLDMLAALAVALVGIIYPMITREMLNDLIPNKNYRMVMDITRLMIQIQMKYILTLMIFIKELIHIM